jgi:alkanesulfonate monooxygenase SsuD/methylene tetrahydromethanopterin reductase-like flavin-dependent oxidoreductase (luciferase family)
MRIGISIASSYPDSTPGEAARQMIERAAAARDAGLATLFVGDHHNTPSPYLQNSPVLGRMLAEWNDNPFGALYLLPLWHPVILAEQVGTLAALAPGRFILQCGLGDHRQGTALGIDMTRRAAMFEASLQVLRSLWQGERVSEDRFWGISDARISPVPEQPVEVWIGSVAAPAIERTARLADGWLASPGLTPEDAAAALGLYREACRRHGRTPTAIALRRDFYVGADGAEAKRTVQPYLDAGYRGMRPDALAVGSPAEIADQFAAFREMGFTDICVRNIVSDQSLALASIERLAEVRERLG